MKERLAKLIDVKSIVTLIYTLAFVIGVFTLDSIPQEFITINTVIISFYFGTQISKNK